jgi:carbonic anhydrase/acetyltransferase-like protein (isoleucine patch superfamily)
MPAMPSYGYRGKYPVVAPGAWVAPTASLIGDVVIEDGASIWFNSTLRGDMAQIVVGKGSSVQDNVVIHTEEGGPTKIGSGCMIGSGATVHSSLLENDVVIGGRAVLAGSNRVGAGAMIRPAAVLPEGATVPAAAIMDGVPARPVGRVDDEERRRARERIARDQLLASEYASDPD